MPGATAVKRQKESTGSSRASRGSARCWSATRHHRQCGRETYSPPQPRRRVASPNPTAHRPRRGVVAGQPAATARRRPSDSPLPSSREHPRSRDRSWLFPGDVGFPDARVVPWSTSGAPEEFAPVSPDLICLLDVAALASRKSLTWISPRPTSCTSTLPPPCLPASRQLWDARVWARWRTRSGGRTVRVKSICTAAAATTRSAERETGAY